MRHLLAREIRDVEHVDGLLAEGRDVRRGDVEEEVGQRARQLVEQARPVAPGHLDHGELIGERIVDDDLRLDREGHDAARRRAALGQQILEPDVAAQQAPDHVADAAAAAELVLVVLELAVEQEGVERIAVARRHDVGAGDVGAGGGAGAGEQRQQTRMVRRHDGQLGDCGEGVRRGLGGELPAFAFGALQQLVRARPGGRCRCAASSRDSGAR